MDIKTILYMSTAAFLFAEAFTPKLYIFICLALANLSCIFIYHFNKGINIWILLPIFIGVTIFNLLTIRKVLKKIVPIPNEKQFESNEDILGQEGMVFKTITKTQPGLVKLLDIEDKTIFAISRSSEIEIGNGTIVKVIEKLDNNYVVDLI